MIVRLLGGVCIYHLVVNLVQNEPYESIGEFVLNGGCDVK